MAPTSFRPQSRGNCVSASRVITYFIPRNWPWSPANRGKPIIFPQQQIIQIKKFSALAFPAHPYFFAGIEAAISVKQEKCAFPPRSRSAH